MITHGRLVVLLLVLWAIPARASEVVDMGAGIVKVLPGKQVRATLDRGKRAGLKVGVTGEVFPMRKRGDTAQLDFNVRIATGRVVELTDTAATIALDGVVETVEPGASFIYELSVPDELARSTLFRVVALGIEMRPQESDVPFITVEVMLADPSPAPRDATLDAMIANIKGMKDVVMEQLKERIEGGKHHGKLAGQVVDELDRAQLLDFLLFVEAFPGKYIGNHYKLPEMYFTWVINGTESGEPARKLRVVAATIKLLDAAIAAGKLDDARKRGQAVLREIPDHKDAGEKVTRIDKIQQLERTLADDPDDTASRYTLTEELFTLGAYDLAVAQNENLRKRGYDAFKVERMRALLLARLNKWQESHDAFKRLAAAHPEDKNLAEWVSYTHAHARLAIAANDPAAHFELAAIGIVSKDWDMALAEYRSVIDSKAASAKQRETATAGQGRIALQKDLEFRRELARNRIRTHEIRDARLRILEVLELVKKLDDPKQIGAILVELSDLAQQSAEEELALELYLTRTELVPDDRERYYSLGWALLQAERLDDAQSAAKTSLEKNGDPYLAHILLAMVAIARDDLATAQAFAKKAEAERPKYAYPLMLLARLEAAHGDWEAAAAHIKRAVELQAGSDLQSMHAAVALGRQAFEALQADPASPRERLRLARALARLGLRTRTAAEIAKLPTDGTWRAQGWWELVTASEGLVPLNDRLAAAHAAKPATEMQRRTVALLEARGKLRTDPKNDGARIALAGRYLQAGDFDRCLATLGALVLATPLRPDVGDLVRDAREGLSVAGHFTLASDAIARDDHDGATRLAIEAQKVHDRIGTIASRYWPREVRSDVLAEHGQVSQALALLDEGRKIAIVDGDVVEAATFDRRIGAIHANAGTNDELQKAIEDARKLCEDLDDEACLYSVHLQLAWLDGGEGRSATAIEHSRAAWALADRLAQPDLQRAARFRNLDTNLIAGRYDDVEQTAIALLADSRKANDVENEQYSLMALGAVAAGRGQGKSARVRFKEVYDLGTRTGNTMWRAFGRDYEAYSWLETDHDPAKAVVAFEQADALYKTFGDGWATASRGSILRNLADAQLQLGKLAAARQAAEEGYALAQRHQRRPGLAASQWILAMVSLGEGKTDEALTHAKDAVAFAEKTDDSALVWRAWHALARAEASKGHDKAAADAYDKTIEHLGRAQLAAGSEGKRGDYLNTGRIREAYGDATEHFLKMGNSRRAMEILDASHDALHPIDPTKIQTTDAKLRAHLDHYQQTQARMAGLQKQLATAMDKPGAQRSETQVKALGERIAKTREELRHVALDLQNSDERFQKLMDPRSLLVRRASLPADSVLVEYFVAADALYAFVISAGLTEPSVVRVKVASAELEKAVAAYRVAVLAEQDKVKQRDKVEALGRKLGDWVLRPLHAHLDGAKTVIVVPFGPLYFIPFDALVVSEAGAPLRYAIEDYRISIQTKGTIDYLLGAPRARSSGTMLAISNPDGSLPGAQLEVNRIVKTAIPDAHVLGRDATVKKFQDAAGGFRYVHIATHGILAPNRKDSFMKLADGHLTVDMIEGLRGLEQGNEMVVLSACDTALEEGNSTGDGIISIAAAFSDAGSPALVASLWGVSDDSTADLMATFYRALEENKAGDRLDALRNAKLNLLRGGKYAAPWHWSAFQLYGDFRAPTSAAK